MPKSTHSNVAFFWFSYQKLYVSLIFWWWHFVCAGC